MDLKSRTERPGILLCFAGQEDSRGAERQAAWGKYSLMPLGLSLLTVARSSNHGCP